MITSSSFGVRVWGVRGMVQVQKGLMERKGRSWMLEGGGQGGKKVCRSMRRVHSPSLRTQNQQGDHMSEPNAAPVAAPASMPMASGAPAL